MVCGGFTCSKNALCSLNVVYMLVGLLLIGVAAWGKGFGLVSSIHIIGGVIAVGVFLLLIAIVGLIGAIHHHQVMLFFYMVILFIVFLFQFGVSCSCLALNRGQQVSKRSLFFCLFMSVEYSYFSHILKGNFTLLQFSGHFDTYPGFCERLLNSAWGMLPNKTKVEYELDCCGLLNTTATRTQFDSDLMNCNAPCRQTAVCHTCGDKMLNHANEALKILGGVGLFFSFTEILGVWLAVRYRNQKDPRANPSAFL
ncbi:Tetraspanin-31 [Merluccius polli]|uniref:Tetraspanin-31 n=1 Tax=Merluccius polli TaxID=89951 RepID=A0AA47MUG8_MERPO|nr:Tetraspanin-31 [Merluccius polli]